MVKHILMSNNSHGIVTFQQSVNIESKRVKPQVLNLGYGSHSI